MAIKERPNNRARQFQPTNSIVSVEGETETPEEIARDNEEWDAIIANTPPEKMAKLKQMFTEQLKRGGITPLDFTDK